MNTAGRGNTGEAMVLAALVRQGFDVSIPFGEGQPFDLVVHTGAPTCVRVQCKTAWPQRGCMVFNSRSTDHGQGRQRYDGLADIFGVYFPPTSSVYLVPIDAVAGFAGRLRLDPPRNNQRRGIRLAAGFEIERWSLQRLREVLAAEARQQDPLSTVA
ncbi:MAG TPA: group I intron-associated PD-(D/E)XK endonuclease [Solirubrobacterales bacterium]|nr:group I intron-associated PD-(D/E)XK endonuclease [Solirubrobacterales bacterium]